MCAYTQNIVLNVESVDNFQTEPEEVGMATKVVEKE